MWDGGGRILMMVRREGCEIQWCSVCREDVRFWWGVYIVGVWRMWDSSGMVVGCVEGRYGMVERCVEDVGWGMCGACGMVVGIYMWGNGG